MQERLGAKQRELDAAAGRVRGLLAEKDAQAVALARLQAETENDVAALAQPSPSGGAAAPLAGDAAGALRVEQMTIQEIKEWLTERGHEAEVWELTNRKTPRVKKADWVDLMRSKQGGA